MKGDFSRGFDPDRRRDPHRQYRRVLLQQGRLLLDSDVNALVGALDGTRRAVIRDLGCAAGSPDLGYLITPGPLLALFRSREDVVPDSGGHLKWRRDYGRKFKDRYPSLWLHNTGTGDATMGIRLRQPHDATASTHIRVHIVAKATVSVTLSGHQDDTAAVNVPPVGTSEVNAAGGFVIRQLETSRSTSQLDITLPAQAEVWIGMVESRQDADGLPSCHAAAGRYHVDGLGVGNREDDLWTAAGLHETKPVSASAASPTSPSPSPPTSPSPAPPESPDSLPTNVVIPLGLSPAANQHFVAYLEVWERHLTSLDDPGIEEVALGGPDTTTRTETLGQVRLMPVTETDPKAIAGWFRAPAAPARTLEVVVPLSAPDPNPCALPIKSGYQGVDNRLYRFEVHTGGAAGAAGPLVKWSRNGGSDRYGVKSLAGNEITLHDAVDLQTGAVVELLAESLELSEASPATVNSSQFSPGDRTVGRLAEVSHRAPNSTKGWILRDRGTTGSFTAPAFQPSSIRLWHGTIEPDGNTAFYPADVEDGLRVRLTGALRPRDYWEYEARVLNPAAGATGPMAPHGPERLFAPLALLRWDSSTEPMTLLAWLDHRFRSLCRLTADDIGFDPGLCYGPDDPQAPTTLQEALEELCQRDAGGGCCEVMLSPSDGDDAKAIQEIIDDPEHGPNLKICLRPGLYTLESPITVRHRVVILAGCPEAVLEDREGIEPALLSVEGEHARLVLRSLTVLSRSPVIIAVDGKSHGVEAEETGLLSIRRAHNGIAISVGGMVHAEVPEFPEWTQPERERAEPPRGAVPAATPAATPPHPDPTARPSSDAVVVGRFESIAGHLNPELIRPVREAAVLGALAEMPWFRAAEGDRREAARATIRLERCVVVAGWMLTAQALQRLTILETFSACRQGGVFGARIDDLDIVDWTHLVHENLEAMHEVSGQRLVDEGEAALPDLGGGGSDLGVALAAGLIGGGSVERCAFGCRHGIYAETMRQTRLHGNRYDTPGVGLWLRRAHQVTIESESIYRSKVAITIRGSAWGVTLRDCDLEADRGIEFPVQWERTRESPSLLAVQVFDNQIAAITAGIVVGGQDAKVPSGSIHGLDVVGNQIVFDRGGLGIHVGPPSSKAQQSTELIRVEGNRITGSRVGLTVFGAPRMEITDNVITSARDYSLGIVGAGVSELLIEDNVLQFPSSKVKARSLAIVTVLSRDVTVRGNKVRGQTSVLGLAAMPGRDNQIEIESNDLGRGGAVVVQAARMELHNNRTRGGVVLLTGSDQGVVANNSLEALETESLIILGIRGRWQVSGNRAQGAIRLLPSLNHAPHVAGEFASLLATLPHDQLGFEHMLSQPLSVVSMGGAESDAVHLPSEPRPDGPPTDAEAIPPGALSDTVDMHAAHLMVSAHHHEMLSTNWIEARADDYILRIDGAFLDEFVAVAPPGPVRPVRGLEHAYRAQVVGNWTPRLQVGFRHPYWPFAGPGEDDDHLRDDGAVPSPNSVVQVVGNMADDLLVVNNYRYRVVTDNATRNSVGVTVWNQAVDTDNLQVS